MRIGGNNSPRFTDVRNYRHPLRDPGLSLVSIMASPPVDYTTYFEFPTLDKIHGEPTFATLLRMKKLLKANAISLTSDLDGGQFGHLGLVLTPQDYTLLSQVPYARPAHLGVLVIPAGTAQHEAIRLREEHKVFPAKQLTWN